MDRLDAMGGTFVEKRVRTERNRRLRLLSEKKKGAFYSRFEGQERPVLWEREQSGQHMTGFTDNHIRVESTFDQSRTGLVELVQLGKINANGHVEIPQMIGLPIL